MLTLRGQLANVLHVPERTDREGKTYPPYCQVQMMVEQRLQDGQRRLGLQTFKVDDPDLFTPLQGREIDVPVGAFVAKGNLVLFMERGARPRLAERLVDQVRGG